MSTRDARRSSSAAVEPIDRVATFFDHVDESADVVQFHEMNGAGKWVYCPPRADIADVRAVGLEEYLADRFGGGKYKVGLRNRTTSVYGKSIVIEVAGPPKSAADRAAAQRSSMPPAAPIAAAPASGNPPSWVERMLIPIGVTFATAAGTFLAKKILEGPKENPLYVELVKNMARGNNAAPAAAAADPLTMMNAMLELQDRIEGRIERRHPPADTMGGLGAVIDRNLPEVLNVMKRKLDFDAQRERRRRLPPGAAAAAPAEETNVPELPTDPLARLLLELPIPARQLLLDAAQREKSPELYAELALDNLDDAVYEQMAELLPRADFVDVLLQIVPAYGDYRPWFVQLVDAMRASIRETQALDDAEGRAGTPPAPSVSSGGADDAVA